MNYTDRVLMKISSCSESHEACDMNIGPGDRMRRPYTPKSRVKLKKMNLNRIFNKCLLDIGGETNEDVRLYRTRPKRISGKIFFEQVIWAIWVSGMRRKSADTFLERAEERGFCWDFAELGTWGKQDFQQFVKKLHGRPVPERAKKKWKAVYSIAKKINGYSSEEDFRKSFFGGKVQSAKFGWKRCTKIGEPGASLHCGT